MKENKNMPEVGKQKKRETAPVPIAEALNHPQFVKQLQIALGKRTTAERYARGVLTAIVTAPERTRDLLLAADRKSIYKAVLTAAQLELDVDAKQHASIVPFKNKKTGKIEAQIIPGYKGYISKARESILVSDVYVKLVYKGDEFRVIEGTENRIEHVPDIRSEYYGNADEAEFAYSVIKYKGGAVDFEIMTRREALEIKKNLRYESDIWVNHFGEMFKKSVVRRHAKRWQLPTLDAVTMIDDTVSKGHIVSYDDGAIEVQGEAQEAAAAPENKKELQWLWDETQKVIEKYKITDEKITAYMAGMYPGTKYQELDITQRREFLTTLKKEYRDV